MLFEVHEILPMMWSPSICLKELTKTKETHEVCIFIQQKTLDDQIIVFFLMGGGGLNPPPPKKISTQQRGEGGDFW